MKESHLWRGEYDGVAYEINNFDYGDGKMDKWTFYLYLWLERIPEEQNPSSFWLRPKRNKVFGRIHYDYYAHPIINNIDFHGDCTWYSKESGFDGTPKVIKIGCDYMHLYDGEYGYSADYIKGDVEKAIRSFREMVPNYKYRCIGNGKLYDLKDGVYEDGYFKSDEYWKNPKNFKIETPAV